MNDEAMKELVARLVKVSIEYEARCRHDGRPHGRNPEDAAVVEAASALSEALIKVAVDSLGK